MSLATSPETSGGVWGSIRGALNIFSDLNKTDSITENSNPTPIDMYESSMDEVEVTTLISQWKKQYKTYYDPIEASQKLAFEYWIGKHRNDEGNAVSGKPEMVDNQIFEALETFLPIATRANPDPLVTADPGEIGQKLAHDIKAALVDLADTLKLRRKLARMTRHWALYRLGVSKTYWDPITKSIKQDNINPKRMLFDKDGFIDEGGLFVGEYEAEKKRLSAEKLAEMFPKKKDIIIEKAMGKKGTMLDYVEWWYRGTDLFYTLDDNTLLGKYKNPNWNYDGVEKSKDPTTQEDVETEIQGTNHLKERTSPYRYLAIFTTGTQPHDETSLILQNIPLQDSVNKTNRQIEKNVDSMNNGLVVSGKAFTEDQASQAASALRRGVAIRVPNGDVREAVQRFAATGLPADVFNNLNDKRNEIKNIFGTSGSTPQGVKSTESVRGKVLINELDSSRIGGGITEQIEQVADSIYNLWVQFMFVYYDEEHFVTTAGAVAGLELISLKNANFPLLKTLSITVKEGSLVPKDPLTQRNEAVDLWSANAIDPLSLYKKLDFPDPVQATNQLILWQMLQKGQIQPQMYLPTFKVEGAQGGLPGTQPATGGPAVNAPTGVDTGATPPAPGSTDAAGAQSQQLLGAVPLP